MSEYEKETWVIWALVALGVALLTGLLLLIYYGGKLSGYEAGQRDALDGTWKYVKLKDDDGREYVVEKEAK